MKNEKNESSEMSEMVALFAKIDRIGPEYVNTVSDEIYAQQPFFLGVLLGYRFDVSPEELEELMKIYFLIWEYFKKNPNRRVKQVTERDFETAQRRNIQMLKYAEGETEESRDKLYSDNWDNLRSTALIAAIFIWFKERPVLSKMNEETKGIILVGIKLMDYENEG
jgi:hypothetical protein